MLHKKTVKIPLFDYPITVIVGTEAELDIYIREKNKELIETHLPVPYFADNEAEDAKVIQWPGDVTVAFLKWPFKRTVVHESVHISCGIITDMGLKVNMKNEELVAYLTDCIFALLDKTLDRFSKKEKKANRKKKKKVKKS